MSLFFASIRSIAVYGLIFGSFQFAPILLGAAEQPVKSSTTTQSKKTEKVIRLVSFPVRGSFPETNAQSGPFGAMDSTLTRLMQRIAKATEDKNISGIILRIRNPSIGRGKVDELRGAIARARAAGMKVYADLEMATATDYLIACSCDEIFMPPSGSLLITGVRAEINFYKGLLEKIGAKAEILQVGDFKGAGEPYTRSSMSPELRKQYESIVSDLYEQLVSAIANARKLDPQRIRELLDTGLFMAADAKKAGLIDHVAYGNQFDAAILEGTKNSKVTIVKNYGKKKQDTDFSGFAGMMKLMNLLINDSSSSSSPRGEKIALIYAAGVIVNDDSAISFLGGNSVAANTLIEALKKAANDDEVKAIVLRIDSPGGSALASDLIWHQIRQSKKPVIASMGDMAASGGYYIAMAADTIFAQPSTLTGSIGVIGGKIALGDTLQKMGVTTDIVSRGKSSGLFSIITPYSTSERESLQKMMEEIYHQFTTKAAQSRKMELAKMRQLAEGKVFTGRQAKKLGLVDKVGTLYDAIVAAKEAAGLPTDKKIEMLILPKPKSFLEQLLSRQSLETKARNAYLQTLAPDWINALADLEIIQHLFRQPVNTMLPYRVMIR
jgi:protease-4